MRLLYLFSLIYFIAIKVRNWLFDKGIYKEFKFNVKTINVGNLTVGGTGKTPQVEYMIRLLQGQYKIATLSRGYGRKTKGFILASDQSTAKTIGDEPLQFYKKYGKTITVAVGEERLYAIPQILDNNPDTSLIILDDAYQHRFVKPHLNILLTDYNLLFFNDYLLPMGRLREDRAGAKRADIIIVSKCPRSIESSEMEQIKTKIAKYNTKAPVFFTGIQYLTPTLINQGNHALGKNIILITGIAKAQTLVDHLSKSYNILKHIALNDHHNYSKNDVLNLQEIYQLYPENSVSIITTEKDMVKLTAIELKPLVEKLPIFYLPIEVIFLKNESLFKETIIEHLQK